MFVLAEFNRSKFYRCLAPLRLKGRNCTSSAHTLPDKMCQHSQGGGLAPTNLPNSRRQLIICMPASVAEMSCCSMDMHAAGGDAAIARGHIDVGV